MKNIINKKLLLSFSVMLFGMFLVGSGNAFAAERVWTGAGSDSNFSTAENWEGDTAPVDGDSIKFPRAAFPDIDDCDTPIDTVVNDLAPEVTLAGMTFGDSEDASTNGTACTTGQTGEAGVEITGAAISMAGDITRHWNDTTTISADVVLADSITISRSQFDGVLDIGTHTLTIAGSTNVTNVAGDGEIIVGNGASLSPSLAGRDESAVFTGTLTVQGGGAVYVYSVADHFLNDAAEVISGGALNFSASYGDPVTFSPGAITLNGGTLSVGGATGGKLIIDSEVTVTEETTLNLYVDLQFAETSTITGKDYFIIADGYNGTVTWPDNSTSQSVLKITTIDDSNKQMYCYESEHGIYVQQNNKFIWNVDCPQRGTVGSGDIFGILAGVGRIGNVTIEDGGVIAPGNSPGTLSTGNLTFEEGGVYEFELAGAEAGQYDQINVTGTVTLGNGTLSVLPLEGFVPTQGQSFVIINNDGTDAVDGVFAGLAEGATVEVDGQPWFTISYIGGDGNDVVLTTIPGVGDAGNRENLPVATYALGGVMALGLGAIIRRKMLPIKNRR